MALPALSLMMLAARSNIPGLLEQPRRSKMRKLTEWQFLCSVWGAKETFTASCMFGPIHKKEFVFLTSGIDTSQLMRSCDGSHQHVQIAGKWSKPSAVYTDELAEALGQTFNKALQKKVLATAREEPEVQGMELEEPQAHQHSRSSSGREADERAGHQKAEDSLSGRHGLESALVKGRSPSDGLRPALRRTVAGALYPAYHFGPTRLLPADHPTRDNDFASPCRSLAPSGTTCTELLQFSKISGLARKGANWVRLVLLLLQALPP